MAFGFLKKKNKEEQEHMSTLEQVRKAYEDLSEDDKKTFHQSLSDRVHESIAAQERADGDEDSQTAADREHEALGAEHADERRAEAREETREDAKEAKAESQHEEADDWRKAMDERLARIEELLTKRAEGDTEALEENKKIYGLGNGVFESVEKEEETITPKEAAEIARKIKG